MSRTFSTKKGSRGEFEVFLQVRLEPEGPPDAHDRVLIEAAGLGHGAGAPMRGLFGPGLQGSGDDLLDLGVGELARLAGAGRIAQGPQAAIQKAPTPLAHGLDRHLMPGRHGCVAQASRAIQHDPGTLGGALIGLGPTSHQFKLDAFLIGQKKGRHRTSSRHSAFFQIQRLLARTNRSPH